MKTKLFPLLVLIALIVATLQMCPFASAQTDISPLSSPTSVAQPTPDAMSKMAEMCQEMMKSEKAMMPFIIGVSVLFALLLFIALVLLIVLEIQWIKYWSRILKHEKTSNEGRE